MDSIVKPKYSAIQSIYLKNKPGIISLFYGEKAGIFLVPVGPAACTIRPERPCPMPALQFPCPSKAHPAESPQATAINVGYSRQLRAGGIVRSGMQIVVHRNARNG